MTRKRLFTLSGCLLLVLALMIPLVAACTTPETTPTPSPKPTTSTPTTTTPAPAPTPETINWKVQVAVNASPSFGPYTSIPESYHAGVWSHSWARWVEEATEGRLKIELLEPDAAFPGTEGLEAIGTRVIDAAWSQPGWYAEKIPEMYVAGGMPGSWMSVGEFYDAWYNYGIYDKVAPLHEALNIKFFPSLGMEYMNIMSSFPMPDPDSVKGHKIRIWGGWGKYVELMGATAITLPYSDCYMGMKLGTIEGVWTGAQSLDTIKLKEVVTDFVTNPNGCINSLLINMDAWNELPEDIQAMMARESEYHFTVGGLMLLEQQGYAIGKAVEDYGLTLWTWSDADIAELRQGCIEEIWPEFAAKTPLSAELVDIVKKQLTEHGKL